jgi:hypothetical protein
MTAQKRQNDEMFIFDYLALIAVSRQPISAPGRRGFVVSFPMSKLPDSFLPSFPAPSNLPFLAPRRRQPHVRRAIFANVGSRCIKFGEARRVLAAWKQSHADDSLGPASKAAAYLFSELARLDALESEFFVDDPASSAARSCGPTRPNPGRLAPLALVVPSVDLSI